MPHDVDILIVGGGMVGGCLAMALNGSGHRVSMLEAVPPDIRLKADAGQRAIALSWGSRCLMQQLGLWSHLQSHAIPIQKIHVSDRGHFGKTRLDAGQLGVGALGYVVAAARIEQAIHEALQDSDIDVVCPAQLTDVDLNADSDHIHATVDSSGHTDSYHARLVVGADGAQSRLRQVGPFEVTHFDYQQSAITTMVRPESTDQLTAYERFTEHGPIALLPHFDGLYSVVWTQNRETSEQTLQLNDNAFLNRLQSAFGQWLGRLELAGPRQQFPLHLSRVEHTTTNRSVLIGNAAHQLHPVAGQGFNLGLRDAAQLAEIIRDPSNDPGATDLLNQYADLRRQDQNLISGFTNQVVQLFSNSIWPVSVLRNSGLLLLDKIPSMKRVFADHTMGIASRQPRLNNQPIHPA